MTSERGRRNVGDIDLFASWMMVRGKQEGIAVVLSGRRIFALFLLRSVAYLRHSGPSSTAKLLKVFLGVLRKRIWVIRNRITV